MFQKPFSFEGRIRRTEYGISFIIYCVVYGIVSAILQASRGEGGVAIIILIIFIPLFWFFFAQGAKRCHDIGNSGWFQLIPLYPLWMLFQEGSKGANEYGQDPKGIN